MFRVRGIVGKPTPSYTKIKQLNKIRGLEWVAAEAVSIFSEQKPYPPKQKAEIMRKPNKTRTSKPSRAAIKAVVKAMAPSGTVSDLKTWNGRNVTAAEWELIERRTLKIA